MGPTWSDEREEFPRSRAPLGVHERHWVANGVGVLHREDGPAVEAPSGYKEWWVRGIFLRSSLLYGISHMSLSEYEPRVELLAEKSRP